MKRLDEIERINHEQDKLIRSIAMVVIDLDNPPTKVPKNAPCQRLVEERSDCEIIQFSPLN